jgi:hypothetical protein
MAQAVGVESDVGMLSATASPAKGMLDDALAGWALYCLTVIPVLLGLMFSSQFVRGPEVGLVTGDRADPLTACIRFDGQHYLDIVQHGYDYDPSQRSTVAFFPAYPLLARVLSSTTGLSAEASLLAVSNGFLALAFVLLAYYVRLRTSPGQPGLIGWTLLAFGLWPGTFFFRMAYAESLLLCGVLLTLIGIHRRWPLVPLALVAGLTTATRPVGVAATAAFLWYVIRLPRERLRGKLGQAALLAPVACWGLLAYMAYQYAMFGSAVAFAQTQENWTFRAPVPRPGLADKLWALATLEPIRGLFDPQSPRFCLRVASGNYLLFSIFFWNPILFLGSAGLMVYGAWRRWLTGPEVVLGGALLAIPYLTRAYEMSMASHARFAAAVVVIYPVLGRLLASWPGPAAGAAVSLSAVLLFYWTALYTAGYPFF